jgi:hypothetical protein
MAIKKRTSKVIKQPKKKAVKKKAVKKKVTKKKKKGNPNIANEGKQYRWKKGDSGNPAGRAQGDRTIAKKFRDQLTRKAATVPAIKAMISEANLGLDLRTATIGEVFALKLIVDAMSGREGIAKEIINRMDGKVPDVIRNEIVDEAKASLDNLTDEQLRRMLGKLGNGSSD